MTQIAVVDFPQGERLGRWHEIISTNFVPLSARPRTGQCSNGELFSQDAGTMQLSEVAGGAAEVSRTAAKIRQSDPGMVKVGLQLEGYCLLNQEGREAALVPGDFAIYDTSRPYSLRFEGDFRMLVVTFPRDRLHIPVRSLNEVTARRISGRQGIGALISPFLVQMGRQLRAQELSANPGLAEAVIALISAAFSEQLACLVTIPVAGRRSALTMRIRAFIDRNIGDPELSTATIAAANHISPRYLQKIFAEDGTTVTEWIRLRRLESSRRDLEDPTFAELPVRAIAARWGILDAAYFSRLFRLTYGLAPGDVRPVLPGPAS